MSLTKVTEGHHAGEFIVSMVAGLALKGAAITGGSFVAGQVMGEVFAAVVAAVGGNTGNGTAGAVTFGSKAEKGVYKLTCTAAAGNAGTFQVQKPDGSLLPPLTVAVAYVSDHINLTLADGAADFIVGDKFTVTVTGDKYTGHDPAATDGSKTAAAVLYDDIDASAADVNGVVLYQLAQVSAGELTWKTGISAGDKATAIEALAKQHIVLR